MFNERDHPRDRDGKFAEKSASELKSELAQEIPRKGNRIKVGEITSSIYDDMVLSNGRRVKDIVTRAVELPLSGSVGAEHIEEHSERKGMVSAYIGVMNDIINDPDYVFEDKAHENTLVIEKKIDMHTVMVVSLNFDNPNYTNTLLTMREESDYRYAFTKSNYTNLRKVLYKKPKE